MSRHCLIAAEIRAVRREGRVGARAVVDLGPDRDARLAAVADVCRRSLDSAVVRKKEIRR
jgi:hypothetical protein